MRRARGLVWILIVAVLMATGSASGSPEDTQRKTVAIMVSIVDAQNELATDLKNLETVPSETNQIIATAKKAVLGLALVDVAHRILSGKLLDAAKAWADYQGPTNGKLLNAGPMLRLRDFYRSFMQYSTVVNPTEKRLLDVYSSYQSIRRRSLVEPTNLSTFIGWVRAGQDTFADFWATHVAKNNELLAPLRNQAWEIGRPLQERAESRLNWIERQLTGSANDDDLSINETEEVIWHSMETQIIMDVLAKAAGSELVETRKQIQQLYIELGGTIQDSSGKPALVDQVYLTHAGGGESPQSTDSISVLLPKATNAGVIGTLSWSAWMKLSDRERYELWAHKADREWRIGEISTGDQLTKISTGTPEVLRLALGTLSPQEPCFRVDLVDAVGKSVSLSRLQATLLGGGTVWAEGLSTLWLNPSPGVGTYLLELNWQHGTRHKAQASVLSLDPANSPRTIKLYVGTTDVVKDSGTSSLTSLQSTLSSAVNALLANELSGQEYNDIEQSILRQAGDQKNTQGKSFRSILQADISDAHKRIQGVSDQIAATLNERLALLDEQLSTEESKVKDIEKSVPNPRTVLGEPSNYLVPDQSHLKRFDEIQEDYAGTLETLGDRELPTMHALLAQYQAILPEYIVGWSIFNALGRDLNIELLNQRADTLYQHLAQADRMNKGGYGKGLEVDREVFSAAVDKEKQQLAADSADRSSALNMLRRLIEGGISGYQGILNKMDAADLTGVSKFISDYQSYRNVCKMRMQDRQQSDRLLIESFPYTRIPKAVQNLSRLVSALGQKPITSKTRFHPATVAFTGAPFWTWLQQVDAMLSKLDNVADTALLTNSPRMFNLVAPLENAAYYPKSADGLFNPPNQSTLDRICNASNLKTIRDDYQSTKTQVLSLRSRTRNLSIGAGQLEVLMDDTDGRNPASLLSKEGKNAKVVQFSNQCQTLLRIMNTVDASSYLETGTALQDRNIMATIDALREELSAAWKKIGGYSFSPIINNQMNEIAALYRGELSEKWYARLNALEAIAYTTVANVPPKGHRLTERQQIQAQVSWQRTQIDRVIYSTQNMNWPSYGTPVDVWCWKYSDYHSAIEQREMDNAEQARNNARRQYQLLSDKFDNEFSNTQAPAPWKNQENSVLIRADSSTAWFGEKKSVVVTEVLPKMKKQELLLSARFLAKMLGGVAYTVDPNGRKLQLRLGKRYVEMTVGSTRYVLQSGTGGNFSVAPSLVSGVFVVPAKAISVLLNGKCGYDAKAKQWRITLPDA